jgi:hypothetical protein
MTPGFMMSFTPLQVNRGYKRKIKRAGTLPKARTTGARQGTAAEEKPGDLKFQRLAANSLDFGQACGRI